MGDVGDPRLTQELRTWRLQEAEEKRGPRENDRVKSVKKQAKSKNDPRALLSLSKNPTGPIRKSRPEEGLGQENGPTAARIQV